MFSRFLSSARALASSSSGRGVRFSTRAIATVMDRSSRLANVNKDIYHDTWSLTHHVMGSLERTPDYYAEKYGLSNSNLNWILRRSAHCAIREQLPEMARELDHITDNLPKSYERVDFDALDAGRRLAVASRVDDFVDRLTLGALPLVFGFSQMIDPISSDDEARLIRREMWHQMLAQSTNP